MPESQKSLHAVQSIISYFQSAGTGTAVQANYKVTPFQGDILVGCPEDLCKRMVLNENCILERVHLKRIKAVIITGMNR